MRLARQILFRKMQQVPWLQDAWSCGGIQEHQTHSGWRIVGVGFEKFELNAALTNLAQAIVIGVHDGIRFLQQGLEIDRPRNGKHIVGRVKIQGSSTDDEAKNPWSRLERTDIFPRLCSRLIRHHRWIKGQVE